jgi:ubiquinone/menaquinone biosynthesis C-methylase UbiE
MSGRPPLDPGISAHYAGGVEADRLQTWGRLEAVRTRDVLARHLPAAPAVVLDVGGGPGAYALWLAERGYAVHLLDPVDLHVHQANEAAVRRLGWPLASAVVGDARALPSADASADVVLLLGPLYHLTESEDRRGALAEAHRVLRPGGLLVAAAISRFASTLDGLHRGFLMDPEFEAVVERDVREGRHLNPSRRDEWFTTAYFHRPDELEREVRDAGFAVEGVIGVEGPGAHLADVDAWLDDPGRRDRLLDALRRVEREPSLLGASPHVLAVARRPGR